MNKYSLVENHSLTVKAIPAEHYFMFNINTDTYEASQGENLNTSVESNKCIYNSNYNKHTVKHCNLFV